MSVKCPRCSEGRMKGVVKKAYAYGARLSYRGSVLKCDTCDHKEVF